MSNYEISKSSLLSLKAEILRKQEDLAKAKHENADKIKSIRRKTPLELKNKGVEERSQGDLNEEDQDLLKLSKSKLETKAKLYEKLSGASTQNEEFNNRYLVQFDKKEKINNQLPSDSESVLDLPVESDEEKYFSDEYDDAVDRSEEWVEYTDCLGRSRKCLRKDLEYLKSKDAELMSERSKSVGLEEITNNSNKSNGVGNEATKEEENGTQSLISNEESELLSGDMRREMLRQQWEKEEEELKEKSEIHYQNVLFNEARQHGVGYYAFSKDEEERAKQQEALKKIREETEQKQKKAQDLKALREKQMAARMKAARNRKRARLGLPPEEDDPAPTESKQESEETQKQEERKRAEEEAEKLLMEARKRYVRPWDIGKEGVGEHYEMTQEEWNEKKRQERPVEFAPPTSYTKREFSSMKSLEDDFEEEDKLLKFSSKKRKKLTQHTSQTRNAVLRNNSCSANEKAPANNSDEDTSDRFLQDYTKSGIKSLSPSSATLRGLNPYKNSYYEPTEPTSDNDDDDDALLRDFKASKTYNAKPTESIPIINELEEVDFGDRLLADYKNVIQAKPYQEEDCLDNEARTSKKKGVEIAPPPTFQYYGPGEGKRAKTSSEKINIAASIEAGLKFLRKQADRKGRHFVDNI